MSKLSDTLRGLAVELGAESPLEESTVHARAGIGTDPGIRTETGTVTASEARAVGAQAVGSPGPADAATAQSSPSAEHEYAIYTSAGRIYIQDAMGKVIALGDLLESAHIYRYELDEGGISGDGFPDLGSALRDLSQHITFAYLDNLFRSQIDVADEASLHSVSVPAIRVRLTPSAV